VARSHALRMAQLGALTLALGSSPACSRAQLEASGDAMLRVERATEGAVDVVIAYKEQVLSACEARDLATRDEREACVEPARRLVDASEPVVLAVRAALVSFWEVYPLLEARIEAGKRITPEDFAELAARAQRVSSAYRELLGAIKDTKR